MSLSPDEAFNKFLEEKIRFSGSESDQAGKSQQYLREQLEEYANNNSDFPNFIDGDFLSGSFGRKTAITPLNDVDVFMILDGTSLIAIKDGYYSPDTVEGGGNRPNPLCNDIYKGADAMISSQKVINAIAQALKQTIYPSSKVGSAGQAVNVWLESYNLGLDIIPALHLMPPGAEQDYYFIPAGNEREDWIETNPKVDAAILDSIGGDKVSALRDIIRLLRYWNQECNHDRLNGYHVEILCLRILENYTITQRRYAVEEVFRYLSDLLILDCPSQTGFGDNIDGYLSKADRDASAELAKEARKYSGLAVAAEGIDNVASVVYWQLVFGDEFPTE